MPLLVFAPPGAGKTHALNRNEEAFVDPEESIDWRLALARYGEPGAFWAKTLSWVPVRSVERP
jgi:hypothetical protein